MSILRLFENINITDMLGKKGGVGKDSTFCQF